jgi:hypothetical protein
VLGERELRLYARQVILRELGATGQAQLCASEAVAAADADPAAAEVALDYLLRAGMRAGLTGAPTTKPVPVATSAEVQALSTQPELADCARWLLGAWAAVEAIKHCAGVGTAAAAAPQDPWRVETT